MENDELLHSWILLSHEEDVMLDLIGALHSFHSHWTMIFQGIAIAGFLLWYFLLRPRSGGTNAPPMVQSNNGIPIIGVLMEFFKSPNTMVQRCYKEYGGVFTIPVCK